MFLTIHPVWASWGRSLIYFSSILVLEMVLGFVFAVILNNLMRGRSLMLSIVLLPMFLAPVMVGLLGRFVSGLNDWPVRQHAECDRLRY